MNISYFERRFLDAEGMVRSSELVDFLEDYLLEYPDFSSGLFEFMNNVFSGHYSKSWTGNEWKILKLLLTENMKEQYIAELSDSLSANFAKYEQYMLCDMTCDFIARKAGSRAIDLFRNMVNENEVLGDTHAAALLVGLNILLNSELEDEYCDEIIALADKVKPLQGQSCSSYK